MPPTENPGLPRRLSLWWVCVCFLLTSFFLYNPFFTVYGASPVLSLRHPPSYRGTVASSELRRSMVSEAEPKVYVPEEAALESAEPSAVPAEVTEVRPQEPLVFQPQWISESLWFRPPPVL